MKEMLGIETLQQIIEFVGTLAFAISGIRLAAAKHFDWFGGYVVGLATAIGAGTLRAVMLGVTPLWLTTVIYLVCTAVAQLVVIVFSKNLIRLNNTWFIFDTLGLALFTVAGMQKTLQAGFPFWVAIIMGCITGAAGGVIRDVLINEIPLIFRKEIYAMGCVLGGIVYWLCTIIGCDLKVTAIISFFVVVIIRVVAVKYHISLPVLKGEGEK